MYSRKRVVIRSKSAEESPSDEQFKRRKIHVTPDGPKDIPRGFQCHRGTIEDAARPDSIVTSPTDVLFTLMKSIDCTHELIWIHRDIKAEEQRPIQASGYFNRRLESAKIGHKDGFCEIRVGSLNFMAAEVMRGHYLFNPEERLCEEGAFTIEGIREQIRISEQRRQIYEQTLFIANEAHDFESLWWTAFHVLFFRDDVDAKEDIVERVYCRDWWMHRDGLFPIPDLDKLSSIGFFRHDIFRHAHYTLVNNEWLPKSFVIPMILLLKLTIPIRNTYMECEADFPSIRRMDPGDLLEFFLKTFEICGRKAASVRISSRKPPI